MANSSDWLGRMDADDCAVSDAGAPGWMTLLDAGEGFRETAFFAEPQTDAPAVAAHVPEADAPDPLAEAIAKAFAEGERAGRAAAEAEAEASAARQRALRLNFRTLDEAALGVLAQDLADTVMTLAQGVLAEAAIDRDGLLARCAAAARRIGGATNSLALHLHPDDADMIGAEALAGWRVVVDPGLPRGGLRIEGPDSTVSDGPDEWRRAIAAAVRA